MSAQTSGGELPTALVGIVERTSKVANVIPVRGTRLEGDLGLDSLSMIDIAVAAEEAFGIRIPDDDLERFVTVGDVADYVLRKKS
jgi:acyl carrier protein